MDQRLDGWKSIASFLGRDERTAKRWEASRGLPVHRVPGGNGGSVFATVEELGAWLSGRSPRAGPDPRRRSGMMAIVIAIVVVLAVAALVTRHIGAASVERPHDEQAANLYFAGLHALSGRTPAGITQAIKSFDATLAIEPRFAPALVGLADSYNLIREFGTMPDAVAYPKAEQAARAAIAIDPDNAGAHRALAFVLFNFHHDAPAAEGEFRHALDLGPNDARTHHWWATTLLMMGRASEALQEIDLARALDPEVTAIQTDRALILAQLGQLDTARAELGRLAALDPNTPGPPRWGARLALIAHDGVAFVALERTEAALRGDAVDMAVDQAAAQGLKSGGWVGMIAAVRDEIERLHAAGRVDDYRRAETAAIGGDLLGAAALLRTMFQKRDAAANGIIGDPAFAVVLLRDPSLAAMARAAMRIDAP